VSDITNAVPAKMQPPLLQRIKELCQKVEQHKAFNYFITILIIANTVIIATDKFPITESHFNFLEISNYVFYIFFTLEMILKIVALGFRGYIADKFNVFDAIIVVLNTVDIMLSVSNIGKVGNQTLSVFRGFRILRLLKLVKSWKNLQELLSTIGNTLKDIRNFSVLLLVTVFTYTLLGMELFAYRMKFNEKDEFDLNGESPRRNFDSFLKAFASIFNILQGEDWHFIMFDGIRAKGFFAMAFFVSLVLLGQIILLNLLLAVLLENFEEKRQKATKQKRLLRKSRIIRGIKACFIKV